ncbi:MAG: cytochrome c3 family protein [Thermoguttaceae bacterium]
MLAARRTAGIVRFTYFALAVLVPCCAGLVSCKSPDHSFQRQTAEVEEGWPKGHDSWQETQVLPAGWMEGKRFWKAPSLERLQAAIPGIEGAEYAQMDEFCETCHGAYSKAFANNVHREQGCEKCHGPATRHLEGRGTELNSILSFRSPKVGTKAGRLLQPAERSEVCLQCHENAEQNPTAPCGPGSSWRTSVHSHKEVACTDCHRAHYDVPAGTPPVDSVSQLYSPPQGLLALPPVALAGYQDQGPFVEETPRGKSHSLNAIVPDGCYLCHEEMRRMGEIVHPHQIGVPFAFECTQCHNPPPRGFPQDVKNHPAEFNCTTCHDPHGNVLAETRRDLCLKCHDNSHINGWHSSPHDAGNVACTDCHDPHSRTGPPMHVDEPQACYRCHDDKRDLELVAHAHQVNGPNEFKCSTCHNPHQKIQAEDRKDRCLTCHDGAPTMAWHSSTHELHDVACTDCHNPHPKANVARVVAVSHTSVRRPNRLPMSVDEPEACYKCHQQIYGMASLPSHHPIREGKMVCSDCHDAHGQAMGNLKEDTINAVCYECHAEKEGPFAYEHAPVTENCAHCHEPHGTVANNLLRQPTTFLCLRCHAGHSTHNASDQCLRCHFVDGDPTNVGGGPLDPSIPTTPTSRQALFTDCTQCHSQVHGSDLPYGMECFNRMIR